MERSEVFRTIVEEAFGRDIETKSRETRVVAARNTYFRLMRKYTTLSLSEIGAKVTPAKDHATVLYSCDKYKMPDKYKEMERECMETASYVVSQSKKQGAKNRKVKSMKDMVKQLTELRKRVVELSEENDRLSFSALENHSEKELIRVFRELNKDNQERIKYQAEAVLKMQE